MWLKGVDAKGKESFSPFIVPEPRLSYEYVQKAVQKWTEEHMEHWKTSPAKQNLTLQLRLSWRVKEIQSGGVWGEDVETFTEDTFGFQEARIVGGNEGAGVVVLGGLRGLDGMREEGMGICLEARGQG